MKITISFARFRRALVCAWCFFVISGLLVELLKPPLCASGWGSVVHFLGLSYEQNLPTWYSSSLLLMSSVALALIAVGQRQSGGRYIFHWWLLALAFAYISLDEAVEIHENASLWFDFRGFLYFGWVIPASLIVIVMGLTFVKFLWHLPQRTRNQFIISGAVYVGGALGVEFLLGYWSDLAGTDNLGYFLIDWVQESMEILGVTLFLCSLLEQLGSPAGCVQVRIKEMPTEREYRARRQEKNTRARNGASDSALVTQQVR